MNQGLITLLIKRVNKIMKFQYLVIISIILLFSACANDEVETIPDVSHLDPDFSVVHFEDDMMKYSVDELFEKYPAFCKTFFDHIIPIRRRSNYQSIYDTIIGQKDFIQLMDTTKMIFADFDEVEKDLATSFQFMRYYLPEIEVPDIFTVVTGFAYQRFLLDDQRGNNMVGLGLDMFLGNTFPYSSIGLDNPAFSNYLNRTFNKEHIPKKTIEMLLEDYIEKPEKNQMLDRMVRNGKKLYLLDKILPRVSDTIIMEYTPEQLEWAENNEVEIWAYFLKEKLFYETNSQKIGKYLKPSPHSPGMPPEAPGRTGNYIGWKIIQAYMKRYPKTTIQELINFTDAQELLQKSRYKPRI